MTEDEHNFQRWYKAPLAYLYMNPDAGFPIMMITMPLLERYLRELTNQGERRDLTDNFFDKKGLLGLFSQLGSLDNARIFWPVFRHGLLHQGALKILDPSNHKGLITVTSAGLNNEADEVQININGNDYDFVVSPVKFSRKVIDTIEGDFPTYAGATSAHHPLAKVF